MFPESERLSKTEIFNIGVNTLLFQDEGVHGYYGEIAMKIIRQSLPYLKESTLKDIIKNNANNSFEELRKALFNAHLTDKEPNQTIAEDSKEIHKKLPDEGIFALILKDVSDGTMYRILLKTMRTFTRQKPLAPDEWTDNFGLNNLGYALTIPVRETDENKNTKQFYTVKARDFKVNKSVKLNIQDVVKNLINPIQAAMVIEENQLIPFFNCELENMIDVVDKIAEKFPNFYAGAHGCDCFRSSVPHCIGYKTISEFIQRYPNNQIGAILNTSTYSERGQHWTAVVFSGIASESAEKDSVSILCTFACSFGQSIGSLHASIANEFQNETHIPCIVQYSQVQLQYDNCNCGLYAVLFLWTLFQFPGNLSAIERIGSNATGVFSEGIKSMRSKFIGVKDY